ncbi:MAG: HAD domain-containing protein [Actinoallomurus sp.]
MSWGIGSVPRPGSRPAPKPLLYLDVDGVLNPLSPNDPHSFTEHVIDTLTVRISTEHGAWLRELADRYQLVWATTWEAEANEHLAPLLGLPDLPVVSFSTYERRRGDPRFRVIQLLEMRKWAPILRHADGRPFAWLDDVIPLHARRQACPYRKALLVPVDPWEGLTRRHVDRLLAWNRR